jgi:hypothetical protein
MNFGRSSTKASAALIAQPTTKSGSRFCAHIFREKITAQGLTANINVAARAAEMPQ